MQGLLTKTKPMKKSFLSIPVIVFALVSFSCKKKDGETTAQKVQHNWTLVNVIDNSHDASGDSMDTTTAMTGDYMNFNSNGTVTLQIDGSPATSSYSIVKDSLLLATQAYSIKVLTDNQFVLYAKEATSATEYDEETINLKR